MGLTAGLTPSRVRLRRLGLSLTPLSVARGRLRLSWEMLAAPSMRWAPSTPAPELTRGVWRALCTPCRLRLTTSCTRPRTPRRRLRRPWLTPRLADELRSEQDH